MAELLNSSRSKVGAVRLGRGGGGGERVVHICTAERREIVKTEAFTAYKHKYALE